VAHAPFSRAAEGARIPEGNPTQTTTFALVAKHRLSADANGELDAVVLPCLQTYLMTTRGTFSGDKLVLANTATTAGTNHQPVNVDGKNGFAFDTSSLGGQYKRYRIVGVGARLRVQSGVNSPGEFTLAAAPLKGYAPATDSKIPTIVDSYGGTSEFIPSYYGTAGPRNTLGRYLRDLGLPYTTLENDAKIDLAKVVNFPLHGTASTSEVAARGMHMRALPYETDVRTFKAVEYSAMGTDATDVVIDMGNNTWTQQLGVDMSAYRISGTESLVVSGAGFTPSAPVATLELIYHVEAVFNPMLMLLGRPTGAIPLVQPTETLDSVLTKIHRIPRISFADVITQVGDSLLGDIEGRAAAAGARGLGSLASALSRLVVASA